MTRVLNMATIAGSVGHLVGFVGSPGRFDPQFAAVGFCATDQGSMHTLEYTWWISLLAIAALVGLAAAYPASGFSGEALQQAPGIFFHALAHLAQVREIPVISFFTKSMAANNEHSV